LIETFETFNEAHAAVIALDDDAFVQRGGYTTKEGHKVKYRCKYNKCRDQQCSASAYIPTFKHAHNTTASVYKSECNLFQASKIRLGFNLSLSLLGEHDHEEDQARLTDKVKYEISRLFKLGITKLVHSFLIIEAIRCEQKVQVPLKPSLVNYLNRFKKKTFGDCNITLDDLWQWFEDHYDLPDDPDQSFCCQFQRSRKRLFFLFLTAFKLV
jgi:hypothetical protein